MSAIFSCTFEMKERVLIDGDESLVGHITAVTFRTVREPLYEVSYVHNGSAQSAWIEEFRLTRK